jgi:hypothetical protein
MYVSLPFSILSLNKSRIDHLLNDLDELAITFSFLCLDTWKRTCSSCQPPVLRVACQIRLRWLVIRQSQAIANTPKTQNRDLDKYPMLISSFNMLQLKAFRWNIELGNHMTKTTNISEGICEYLIDPMLEYMYHNPLDELLISSYFNMSDIFPLFSF